MANHQYQVEFINIIVEHGLEPPKQLFVDGKIHRFKSSPKSKAKNGYYVLHELNGFMAGAFGCWASDVKVTWNSLPSKHKRTQVTEEDLKQVQKMINNLIQATQKERELVQNDRKGYAQSLFEQASPLIPEHAYLAKKALSEFGGIRYSATIPCADFFMDNKKNSTLKDCLLIPVYSIDGDIQSLQAITPNGDKFFMSGGRLEAGHFTFNAQVTENDTSYIYVCEGYATGSTLNAVTGAEVVVSFNANGLKKLVPHLIDKYGAERLIIAADNDHVKASEGKGNKGLDTAVELWEKHNIAYSAPTFSDLAPGTDWNDFAQGKDLEHCLTALNDNLVKAKRTYHSFDEMVDALHEDRKDIEAFNSAIDCIKVANPLEAHEMLPRLKDVSGIGVTELKKMIHKALEAAKDPELSHHEIALAFAKKYQESSLIGEFNVMWTYESELGIWSDISLDKIGVKVAEEFKDQPRCKRESDYRAIATHLYNLTSAEGTFESAPQGLVTPNSFYRVIDGQLAALPHSKDHLARFRLEIEPVSKGNEPQLLLGVLKEAFLGTDIEAQIRQLRMLLGLALFGLQTSEQIAVFLYGAANSGKSLFLKVMQSIVPKQYICNVSPSDMGDACKLASMAGKLLNLVPEIDRFHHIPNDKFKSAVSGDMMQARGLYQNEFSFTPKTANWYNGNFFMSVRDTNDSGFWRRLAIIEFRNSKPINERDPDLLNKIIANELPAVLRWAMDGVEDYLSNGLFLSSSHHSCMQKWKMNSDSVASWLHDAEDNDIGPRATYTNAAPLKVTDAYCIYKDWCKRNSRAVLSKTEFKESMTSLGLATSLNQGFNCYPDMFDKRATNKPLFIRGVA